ncbi:hypothetical protein [Methylomonas methanica]|uniref:Uncharacterized protein n=1 Tax=Methylomonas methanica (strain DSM 25384 / MC09) TaxID=857087 RepID=F9ZVC9_METMM|nr:hypothetical protein [Methylomonas methanica]AEG00739.1 hypothetical protein Metme_2337 [Methylomonas methanica MC09]
MIQVTQAAPGLGMTFQPLESAFAQVVIKYRPQIEALESQLSSDDGLPVELFAPLAEEQKQALLFGSFFAGRDKPLKTGATPAQVESPRAFVTRHKIKTGTFTADTLTKPVSIAEVKTIRAVSLNAQFGLVRFGFIRRHTRSVKQRWLLNDRTRPGFFPGSPVYYLLGY